MNECMNALVQPHIARVDGGRYGGICGPSWIAGSKLITSANNEFQRSAVSLNYPKLISSAKFMDPR